MSWSRREVLARAAVAAAAPRLLVPPLAAQSAAPTDAPKPTLTSLRGEVGFATLAGGTVGWYLGKDGGVVVDAQVPDVAPALLAGLRERATRLDLLINTHHHWDHTGGNGTFKAAVGSIVAHTNVPALQLAAATRRELGPQVVADTTFTEGWRRDFGGEQVSARYFGPAHTGGDIVVLFERAEVAHLGDLVFNRLYPVIDRSGGTVIASWIEVLDRVIATYGDVTYIFGHAGGDQPVVGRRGDVEHHRNYLSALLEHARTRLDAGDDVDTIATGITTLPGFETHQGRGARLSLETNLRLACAELRGEPADS